MGPVPRLAEEEELVGFKSLRDVRGVRVTVEAIGNDGKPIGEPSILSWPPLIMATMPEPMAKIGAALATAVTAKLSPAIEVANG